MIEAPPSTPASRRVVAAVAVACLAYAALRYVVVGPVPAAHLPLYVANKAAAFAGITLLGLALLVAPLGARLGSLARLDRGVLARAGGALSAGHALGSVLLLSAPRFPDLYAADGLLTGRGEVAMAAGVVATVALLWQGHRPGSWRRTRLLVVAVAVAHAAAIGWPKWLAPASWHGGLPPITLLSALIGAGALAAWAALRR